MNLVERNPRLRPLRATELGVVVPCYNQGRYLAECLASIEAQSVQDWRVLVVDDGSDEPATSWLPRSVLQGKVQVEILETNRGVSHARNLGAARFADARFVFFVDADDRLAPDYFERVMGVLATEPSVGAAFGTQFAFHEGGESDGSLFWPTKEPNWSRPLEESVLPGGGVALRVSAFRGTSGWRRSMSSQYEDWELGLQLLRAGWQIAWVPEARYFYRRHGGTALDRLDERGTVLSRARMLRLHGALLSRGAETSRYVRKFITPPVADSLHRGRYSEGARIAAAAGLRNLPRLILEMVRYYLARLAERRARRRGA